MRLHVSCHIFFCLFFIGQLNDVVSEKLDDNELLELQKKIEELIKKIINLIRGYYQEIKADVKCIPDSVSDSLMDTLRGSIVCVEDNEKDYKSGKIMRSEHSRNFLECFRTAKRNIRDLMESVDTTVDYCPDNVTEKTYQINVTSTFSKTFRIHIKNGLEITKKEILLDRGRKNCFDDQSDFDGDYSDGSDEFEMGEENQKQEDSEDWEGYHGRPIEDSDFLYDDITEDDTQKGENNDEKDTEQFSGENKDSSDTESDSGADEEGYIDTVSRMRSWNDDSMFGLQGWKKSSGTKRGSGNVSLRNEEPDSSEKNTKDDVIRSGVHDIISY